MTDFCAGKPACGQKHPVCGSCANTDGGTVAPTITSPATGATIVLDSTNSVTFTWTTNAKNDSYEIQIYPNKTGVVPCTDGYCTTVTGNTITYKIPLTSYANWTFGIRAVNTTCNAAGEFSAWKTITFNPVKKFTGNLYTDLGGTAALNVGTGKCEQAGVPVPADATWRANLRLSQPGAALVYATRVGNVYTANVPYVSNLRATLYRQTRMTCTCPADCSYTNLASDFTYNFYVGPGGQDPWWQTQNGLTYAGADTGTAVVSSIPDPCTVPDTFTVDATTFEGSNYPNNMIDGDLNTVWKETKNLTYNNYRDRQTITIDFGVPVKLGGVKFTMKGTPVTLSYLKVYGLNILDNGNVDTTGSTTGGQWDLGATFSYTPSGTDTIVTINTPGAANITYRMYTFTLDTLTGGAIAATEVSELTPFFGNSCAQPFNYQAAVTTNPRAMLGDSSGVTITGGGDVDVTAPDSVQYANMRGDAPATARAIGSEYKGIREDYDYFYNKYSMGAAPAVDFTGAMPTVAPKNGRAYFAKGNISTPVTAWNLAAAQSLVIFVDGNLTINHSINVPAGSFLAFIVSGDITFANTLGRLPSNMESIYSPASIEEGVFIGDRIIVQGGRVGGDYQFVGEGTYVGWSDVQLLRKFSVPSYNQIYPSELFRYRPDLLLYAPERMKSPNVVWQEKN